MVLDSLFGVVVVVLSILGFISLVWLKDQLSSGEAPQWLVDDRNKAKVQKEDFDKHKSDSSSEAWTSVTAYVRTQLSKREHQDLSNDIGQLEQLFEVHVHVHVGYCVCSEILHNHICLLCVH